MCVCAAWGNSSAVGLLALQVSVSPGERCAGFQELSEALSLMRYPGQRADKGREETHHSLILKTS